MQADSGHLQRHPDIRSRQQGDPGLVQQTDVRQLQRENRPQDRLKLSDYFVASHRLPVAADCRRNEPHAGRVGEDLLCMHDAVIRQQV